MVADNKFVGRQYVIGLENPNAAGLGRVNPFVPAKVRAKVDEAKKMLIAGKIKQK